MLLSIKRHKNVEEVYFDFKALSEKHLPLLTQWLNDSHLQEWWSSGEITLEEVRAKYLPRIMGDDAARPYIIYLEKHPFGYIQYYYASEGDPNWWPDKPEHDVIGIDQFIADKTLLGKGYGTLMIIQFIHYLKSKISISQVRVDPRADNSRAIRCYEKVGFRKTHDIMTPDGPALMLQLDINQLT